MMATVKPIGRHFDSADPARSNSGNSAGSVKDSPRRDSERESRASRLVAEWQFGPETLSGLAIRKLRLAFAPPQSAIIASAAG